MDAHPAVLFRDGPAGRRDVLVGGPDVADVIGGLISGDVPVTRGNTCGRYISWYIFPIVTRRHQIVTDNRSIFDRERVLEELGDKVLDAFAEAMDATRLDLRRYRLEQPDLSARSSPRGLANMLHDWMWHNFCRLLDSIDGVSFYEQGPIREIIVNDRYRIRLKRHNSSAQIGLYPTQLALAFKNQPDEQRVFSGMEQIRLACGYVWRRNAGQIGPTVLSLRDGFVTRWVHEMPSGLGSATPLLIEPTAPPPIMRTKVPIEFPNENEQTDIGNNQ